MVEYSERDVRSLISVYVDLGIKLGYFKSEKRNNYLNLLNNYKIIFDNNLPGDAKVENNLLIINPKRTFKSKKCFQEILFHEFSHILNDIHRDLYSKQKSFIKQYRQTFENTMHYNFPQYNIDKEIKSVLNAYKNGKRIKSPYAYVLRGAVLLDEAIAENIAQDMISYLYNNGIRTKRIEKSKFADVNYYTDFGEYGIYQELGEKFAKTLRGINNLRDLCVASFDENFTEHMIAEHTESGYTYEALFKELGYLGTIFTAQEHFNGHIIKGDIPNEVDKNMVTKAYYDAIKFCDAGRDNRQRQSNYPKLCTHGNLLYDNKLVKPVYSDSSETVNNSPVYKDNEQSYNNTPKKSKRKRTKPTWW